MSLIKELRLKNYGTVWLVKKKNNFKKSYMRLEKDTFETIVNLLFLTKNHQKLLFCDVTIVRSRDASLSFY